MFAVVRFYHIYLSLVNNQSSVICWSMPYVQRIKSSLHVTCVVFFDQQCKLKCHHWGLQTKRLEFCVLKPLSHQSGVLTASPQRLNKLQNAEVRAVQTPATPCKRCGNAVQSPRTPCGGVYFEHAENKRRGLAFPQRVRQHAVATLWQRCGVF